MIVVFLLLAAGPLAAHAGGTTAHAAAVATIEGEGWTYTENHGEFDEEHPCGVGHDECGPENWELAFEECASQLQSPIDISHVHVSHHLDELRWNISEDFLLCTDVDFEKNGFTYNVTFEGEHCEDVFVLESHGHHYDAKHFSFHFPSEHVIDEEHFDLEVQFYHQDKSGHTVVVAVLVKASHDFADNAFLEQVLRAAHDSNLTVGHHQVVHFPNGSLNFVDTFLPSHGLNFDYYHYEGSLTVPNCGEVTWVILGTPALMSESQLERFKEGFINVTESKWDKSHFSARVVQPLIPEHHLELFSDGLCYTRYCHNLFAIGSSLNGKYSVLLMSALVLFTVVFEYFTNIIDERIKHYRTTSQMVSHIYKELSILGVVSFIAVCIIKSCAIGIDEEILIAFEAMHILIFGIGVAFVFFSGITLKFTYRNSAHWDKLFTVTKDILTHVRKEHRFNFFAWRILGRSAEVVDLGLCFLRPKFIDTYSLPRTFDFHKYLQLNLAHTVTHMLHIHLSAWVSAMVGMVLVVYLAPYFPSKETGFILMGIGILWFLLLGMMFAYLSLKKVLRILDVKKFSQLVEQAEKAQNSSNQRLSVFVENEKKRIHRDRIAKKSRQQGGHKGGHVTQTEMLPVKAVNSETELMKGDPELVKTHSSIDMGMPDKEIIQHLLQKAWQPFGQWWIVDLIMRVSPLQFSFYAVGYLLFGREYFHAPGHTLVTLFVLFGTAYLLPKFIVLKSLVDSIINYNHELVAETFDYETETQDMQRELINFMWENFDELLFESQNVEDALRRSFGPDAIEVEDGVATVDPKHLLVKFKEKFEDLSVRKSHRFKRLLDEDRSGTVEVSEISKIVFNERILRLDPRVFRVFQKHSSKPNIDDMQLMPVKRSEYEAILNEIFNPDKEDKKKPNSGIMQAVRKLANSFGGETMGTFLEFRECLVDWWEKDHEDVQQGVAKPAQQMTELSSLDDKGKRKLNAKASEASNTESEPKEKSSDKPKRKKSSEPTESRDKDKDGLKRKKSIEVLVEEKGQDKSKDGHRRKKTSDILVEDSSQDKPRHRKGGDGDDQAKKPKTKKKRASSKDSRGMMEEV